MSISADGSVKGKKLGRSRVFISAPNSDWTMWSRVPLRSAMVRPSSIASSSTWWKTGVCVASSSSVRYTRPGQIT